MQQLLLQQLAYSNTASSLFDFRIVQIKVDTTYLRTVILTASIYRLGLNFEIPLSFKIHRAPLFILNPTFDLLNALNQIGRIDECE